MEVHRAAAPAIRSRRSSSAALAELASLLARPGSSPRFCPHSHMSTPPSRCTALEQETGRLGVQGTQVVSVDALRQRASVSVATIVLLSLSTRRDRPRVLE